MMTRSYKFSELMRNYSPFKPFTKVIIIGFRLNKGSVPEERRTPFRSKQPASVRVLAGVISTGLRSPLSFMDEIVKINQHVYLNMLRDKFVP